MCKYYTTAINRMWLRSCRALSDPGLAHESNAVEHRYSVVSRLKSTTPLLPGAAQSGINCNPICMILLALVLDRACYEPLRYFLPVALDTTGRGVSMEML